jgi:2-C-methyl-D-erythritol 2,4-cyclodiphosphate synthase
VDCTLVLERPKIMPHVAAMRAVVAPLLKVEEDAVSIKATTNEKMGFVGREEGVCAYAVALVQRIS